MSLWKDVLGELDHRKPLPPLVPNEIWNEDLSDEILSASPDELIGSDASDLAVKSTRVGLLLWNDDIDAAHEIVQDVEDRIGSYWHAILHRREGDFDNAKYWNARVGTYPIFGTLYQQASRLWPECQAWGNWSPDAFVDAVAEAAKSDETTHPNGEALRRIQVVEFSFLLRHGLSL